ncbi:MAG: tRNA pseudouridine(38-40) synthase TruA [Elainellaceae cyanobacterium]
MPERLSKPASLRGSSQVRLASEKTQRVALVIQYLGDYFHGWQRQPHHQTVQEEIEKVLRSVVGRPVSIYGAGRTDAGVHAAAQVAHFDAPATIPTHRWADILNHRLPRGILIRASAAVEPDWHARFSAVWRRYRYTLYTDPVPNLFVSPFTWHYYHAPLDDSLMREALNPMLGYHHLAAFRRAGSDRIHSWVDIQSVICVREGSFIRIEVQANGFLYGMMRLLIGMLVEVGRGGRSPADFTKIWQDQRRDLVKYAAPPYGLCLLRIGYPDCPFPSEVWFDTQPTFLLSRVESAEITPALTG